MRPVFTVEELAELKTIDAEICAAPVSQEERDESRRRDYELRVRDKIAEAKRAYREANRDKIAEAQRAYREANRDKIAEIGAALRRWRLDHLYSQRELGLLLGIGQRAVSFWERGEVPVDFARIEQSAPWIMEAFV